MMYRKHIHVVDNDSLLQVFTCYRLEEEDDWYLQSTWRNLIQVCRRWRYLVFKSPSHLDLCLLLTNDSPSLHAPSHLPPLPLVIYHSDRTRTMVRKDEDNIHIGLQQHYGRVRRVVLKAPSLSLSMWLEPMNKVFPRLEVLSLLSTTIGETNLMLPGTLQAPGLRSLVLHGVGLPRGLTFLSSSITLSTISLTHIGASCYFHPGQLLTQLQSLPHLEELSIGFAIPIPLPSSQGKLLSEPIPPVTLPALRQLTFRGVDIYLDNLVAQINTPLLERLNLTLLLDLAFTLVNLAEFIHRTEGFGCLISRVIFNKDGVSIDTGGYKRGIGKLGLHINCKPLDWQIYSATQVCSTLGKVFSIIEELTVDLNKDGMLSGWGNTLDSFMWHELLLPFIDVKKLRIGTSLTLELSQALGSVAGRLVLELLPDLQDLEGRLEIDPAKNALSSFLKIRESVGRPVRVVDVRQSPCSEYVPFQYSLLTSPITHCPSISRLCPPPSWSLPVLIQLQHRHYLQQQLEAQAQRERQHQAQRAVMEMHRVLSAGLGAGIGGGLMNTSGTNSLSGGLGPMGMGGNMGPTGIAGNNGSGAGGLRNVGLGLGVPAGGTSFGGLSFGTGLDDGGAPGDGGDGSAGGGGLGGMPHGGVTLDMYQSFMQRNSEGRGQGQ